MKLCRCPICHTNIHLDALAQDDAARSMLGLLAPLDGGLGRALVAYISLFRPEKSDLSFSRALKLSQETMALSANRDWLRVAMEETVVSLRNTQAQGAGRQLTNHNYLKKVLQSIDERAVSVTPAAPAQRKPAIEIKSYGMPESLAQSKAKHEAWLNGFKQRKGAVHEGG